MNVDFRNRLSNIRKKGEKVKVGDKKNDE